MISNTVPHLIFSFYLPHLTSNFVHSDFATINQGMYLTFHNVSECRKSRGGRRAESCTNFLLYTTHAAVNCSEIPSSFSIYLFRNYLDDS